MAIGQKSSNGVEVFVSYSHKDEKLRNKLEKHLSPLKRNGTILTWYDRNIEAGIEGDDEIKKHLESASIILLLISPDFMDSNYCYEIEMKIAMERQKSGKARVIPVLLKPCDWEEAPFSKLQILPYNGMPVIKWERPDDAFLNIEQGIKKIITNFKTTNETKIVTDSANYDHHSMPIKNSRVKKGDQMAPNLRELLKYLRDEGCYLPEGHYCLPSGKHSKEYIQARIGMMNSKTRTAFAAAMINRLSDREIEYTMLAAGTVGGILLAKEAAKSSDVPLLVGRKIAGSFAWVNIKDKQLDSSSKIVLVDDILSTGGTLESEIKSLDSEMESQAPGANIVAAVVAVNRSREGKSIITVNGASHNILSLLPSPLIECDPGQNTCTGCPGPIINLYDAENDIIQTIKSMPPEKADMIIRAYKEAYELQQDERALLLINQLSPLLIAARLCYELQQDERALLLINQLSPLLIAARNCFEQQQDERVLLLINQLGPLLIAARNCFEQHEPLENFSLSS